jgi:hypothetical protein
VGKNLLKKTGKKRLIKITEQQSFLKFKFLREGKLAQSSVLQVGHFNALIEHFLASSPGKYTSNLSVIDNRCIEK